MPLFHDRATTTDGPSGVPHGWLRRVKANLVSLGPAVVASRMVRDYTAELYEPTAAAADALRADGSARAKDLAAWKQRVRGEWGAVKVASVDAGDEPADLGADRRVTVTVDLVEELGADGYLYGLRDAPLAGPGLVRDLDVGTGLPDDVDEVTTRDTLSASWDPVPGATGYEVAIAKADGGYVFYPPWQPVDATSYTRTGLALEDGVQYVFAVRAVSAAGRSPDILSDGVLVHRLGPPPTDAGVDQPDAGPVTTQPGGCCSTGSAPTPALALGGLVAAALRRRRRR